MRTNVHGLLLAAAVALIGCARLPEQKIVYVAPQTIKCAVGVEGVYIPNDPTLATVDCLQIRETPDEAWGFTNYIEGFTFEPGFSYRLFVRKVYPDPNLADAFPTLHLIQILEKTPAAK